MSYPSDPAMTATPRSWTSPRQVAARSPADHIPAAAGTGDGGYGEGDHGYGGISKNNSGGSGCACSKCGEKGHMATNISQGGGTQEEYNG